IFLSENFVVSAFSDYKTLLCPLFFITKVCNVRFFITKICSVHIILLENFVVSAFSLQSLYIFSLQQLVVSAFFYYNVNYKSL
ncbi:hypothetical protein K443DRAFT_117142, partial [Laccaria amethystina LaAM-08-1]